MRAFNAQPKSGQVQSQHLGFRACAFLAAERVSASLQVSAEALDAAAGLFQGLGLGGV